MKIKDIKAIKAAELLKQYCGERDCANCIFTFLGDCILAVSDYYVRDDYVPRNWDLDLVKED